MFKPEHQEFLKKFATPEHYSVEQAPLAHPDATEDDLLKHMDNKNWNVRLGVVNSEKAGTKVLNKAVIDDDPDIRVAAIYHPKATKEILEKGLNDNNPHIRGAVIHSPNVTKEMLERLLTDPFINNRAGASYMLTNLVRKSIG